MPGPSAAKLAKLRAKAQSYMPEPCVIRRPGSATSAGGGVNVPSASTTINTVCKLVQDTARYRADERIYSDRLEGRQPWVVLLPYGTGLRLTDTIEVLGKKLEVIAVTAGQTYALQERATCAELRPRT